MRGMRNSLEFLFLLGITFVFSFQALAARNAKIVVKSANVHSFPRPDSKVIGTISYDFPIQVSNFQTNGFFKTRIPGGMLGWISGSDIFVSTPEPTPEMLVAKPEKTEPPASPLVELEDRSRIQLSGGLHFISMVGLPAGIDASDANTGIGGSVELQYSLVPMFFVAARIGFVNAAGSVVGFNSLPVQAGISFVPVSFERFRFGVGAYGGMALLTSLTIEKDGKKAQYDSSGFIGTGNVQMSYSLGKRVAILLDADYRLHSMDAPEGTSADGLQLPAFTSDFSGLSYRLGLELRL